MTLAGTMDLAARLRTGRETPIILMGYANPVYHMGYGAFAGKLAEAGGDGAIIPDLPMESAARLRDAMWDKGLALIPMAAPNTPPERLAAIVRSGSGFLYLVSMAGLTGDAIRGEAPWRDVALRARGSGNLPVCLGFGIRSGQDAARAAEMVDGVIVGSAVTRVIGEASNSEGAIEGVRRLVGELKEAIGRK